VARVRLKPGRGSIDINGRSLNDFFTEEKDRRAVLHPLEVTETTNKVDVMAKVTGGGYTGQAGPSQPPAPDSRRQAERAQEVRPPRRTPELPVLQTLTNSVIRFVDGPLCVAQRPVRFAGNPASPRLAGGPGVVAWASSPCHAPYSKWLAMRGRAARIV